MVKTVSWSCRDHIYEKVFPDNVKYKNKSERMEKLILLGLEKEEQKEGESIEYKK